MPPATAKPSTAAMIGFIGRLWRSSACQWMSGTSDISCMNSSSGLARAHRLQVGAGAEDVAAAGEDRDAQLGIVVEHAPGAVHAGQHAGAERVLRLGAVQRDGQHVAVAFEQAVVAIHRGSCDPCRMSKSSSRGRAHLVPEAVAGERPRGRQPRGVEVPALAAAVPDGLRGRRPPFGVEARHRRRATGSPRAARADRLDELEDVAHLQLRDLDQREVADRTVGTVQHEEVGEVGDRDRQVRERPLLPDVVERNAVATR